MFCLLHKAEEFHFHSHFSFFSLVSDPHCSKGRHLVCSGEPIHTEQRGPGELVVLILLLTCLKTSSISLPPVDSGLWALNNIHLMMRSLLQLFCCRRTETRNKKYESDIKAVRGCNYTFDFNFYFFFFHPQFFNEAFSLSSLSWTTFSFYVNKTFFF